MNEELDTWLKSLQQVTTMSSSNKMEIWTEIKVKLVKNINIINNLILDCVPPVVVPSANNILSLLSLKEIQNIFTKISVS